MQHAAATEMNTRAQAHVQFFVLLLVTRPRESITCTDGLVVHGPLHADTKSVGSLVHAIYIKHFVVLRALATDDTLQQT